MLLNNKQDREAVGEQTPRFHSHWGSCVNQSGRPAGGPVWTLKADAFKFETIPCYSMQFFIDSVVVFFLLLFFTYYYFTSWPILSLTLLLYVSHSVCYFTSICLSVSCFLSVFSQVYIQYVHGDRVYSVSGRGSQLVVVSLLQKLTDVFRQWSAGAARQH